MTSKSEIAVANATSRNTGAVGSTAIVPRYVRETFGDLQELWVLDFGAGKHAAHAVAMREAYASFDWYVDAYEFGANVVPGVHLSGPAQARVRGLYGIVYASNVLNVQSSSAMLQETVRNARSFLKYTGRFICNYPASPRKSDLTADDVEAVLRLYFATVRRVGGTKQAPMWSCEQGAIE